MFINQDQIDFFKTNGYLFVKELFDKEEIKILQNQSQNDLNLEKNSVSRKDSNKKNARLTIWNYPENNIYGLIAKSKRIVKRMETFLEGEVYHYHSKMILKDALDGGAWEWHQDYGYWYENGCLRPLMASVMIAVDEATKKNGCLRILKKSHEIGRIDHYKRGDQSGADIERVNQAKILYEEILIEMRPGDSLFFHCNLLHSSSENLSKKRRWSMICCYNAKRNNPFKDSHHPKYKPLEIVDDNLIKMHNKKNIISNKKDIRDKTN